MKPDWGNDSLDCIGLREFWGFTSTIEAAAKESRNKTSVASRFPHLNREELQQHEATSGVDSPIPNHGYRRIYTAWRTSGEHLAKARVSGWFCFFSKILRNSVEKTCLGTVRQSESVWRWLAIAWSMQTRDRHSRQARQRWKDWSHFSFGSWKTPKSNIGRNGMA